MDYIRQSDIQAYQSICANELFLRKLFRWEIRNKYGRQWYAELSNTITTELENRIESDRKKGYFPGNHATLSYIDLRALLSLIFNEFWDNVFKKPFGGKRSLYNNEFEDFARIRNKVGHFRPVNQIDLNKLKTIHDEIVKVINYYSGISNSTAYISGDPESASDDYTDEIDLLILELREKNRELLWEFYDSLNSQRQIGLSPGIGVISEHVFFEYYTNGCFYGDELYNLCINNEQEITFLNLAKYGNYVRIFIPLSYEFSEIKKSIKKFTKAASCDLQDLDKAPTEISNKYKLGSNEILNINSINTYSGFVF